MNKSFSELKKLKSRWVSSSFLFVLIFDVSSNPFRVGKEAFLGALWVRNACPDSDHCHTSAPPKRKGIYRKVDVCLGMTFFVAIASAVCVLLHRENVIATHRFCQERIKSSGKQWKRHIIFNSLINYRSKPFKIIMLMECHGYSTISIFLFCPFGKHFKS